MQVQPDGHISRSADGQTHVRFQRDYATNREDLWSAITTPDRISRWLAPVTEAGSGVGSTTTVDFDDGRAVFEVSECDPPGRLVAMWLGEPRSTRVKVTLEQIGPDRTRLLLVHSLLTATSAPGYAGGWHWHLDALSHLVADTPAPPAWEHVAAAYR